MSVSETETAHESPVLVLAIGLIILVLGVPAVIATSGAWYIALPVGTAFCVIALRVRSSVEGRILRVLLGFLGVAALVMGAMALVG